MDKLTLRDLLMCHAMINDETKIIIRDRDSFVVAVGNWMQDSVLEQAKQPIASLSYWAEQNRMHIDLK